MSTRTQIRFIGPYGEVRQVYRHNDGYPDEIIADLVELFDVMDRTGTRRGASYAAANFVFFDKLRRMKMYYSAEAEDRRDSRFRTDKIDTNDPHRVLDPSEFAQFDQPSFLLGNGVENGGKWHGDEEWLYEVDHFVDGVNVRVAGRDDFPRFEDLDKLVSDDPWGEIQWSFDGALEEAYDRFIERQQKI